MENKAHKIDKIFKNSLDNQSVTPPADAWMAVHTYTIGQEESKKRVWLRYASLALLVLLFSGLGLWYNINLNSDSSDLRISGLKATEKIHKSTNLMNPNSDYIPASKLLSHELLVENTNNGGNLFSHEPTLLSHELLVENTNNGENLFSHEPTLLSHELLVENTSNGKNTVPSISEKQIENIEPKHLILNDLSAKMQKECERKIIALEENIIDKKDGYKADSVVYEKKFSLKHPILSFAVGSSKINWKMTEEAYSQNLYNETTNCQSINIGIAWKLTRKTRLGLKLGLNKINEIKIGFGSPLQKNATGTSYLTLNIINSDIFYKTETPFGDVNVPINLLKDWGLLSDFPILYDKTRYVYYFPQSMQTFQCDVVLENDLFSHKRKSQYLYQFYFLTDVNIQRQITYNYLVDRMLSDLTPENKFPIVSLQLNHLQNASEVVFGLRAGLGFRYQFAKKWDFYVEGSAQHSLNNWLKSENIKTFQRTLSLQAGVNLNL